MINIKAAKELQDLDSILNEKTNDIKKKLKDLFKEEVDKIWKEFEAFFKQHGSDPHNYLDGERTLFNVSIGRLFIEICITKFNDNIINVSFTEKANNSKKDEYLMCSLVSKLHDLKHSDKDKSVEELIPLVKDLIKKADDNLNSLNEPKFILTKTIANQKEDVGSLTDYLKTKFQ